MSAQMAEQKNTYQSVLRPSVPIASDASVARQTANAMVYQAVAQSAALAVQSATSYTLGVTRLAEAVTATALAKVVENLTEDRIPQALEWAVVPLYADLVVISSAGVMATVSAAAKQVLKDFSDI